MTRSQEMTTKFAENKMMLIIIYSQASYYVRES